MKIELTKEEADALLRLVDTAVRSGGLQAAEPALFFMRKISEAARAEAAPVETPVEDKAVKGKPNGSAGRDDRAAAARA